MARYIGTISFYFAITVIIMFYYSTGGKINMVALSNDLDNARPFIMAGFIIIGTLPFMFKNDDAKSDKEKEIVKQKRLSHFTFYFILTIFILITPYLIDFINNALIF